MKRTVAALALAVFVPALLIAAQDAGLPKNITLTLMENEQQPYRFKHVGSEETVEAQARSAGVFFAAPISFRQGAKPGTGKYTVILKSGSYVAANAKTGKTNRETFATLEMTFTPMGNMIDWTITR